LHWPRQREPGEKGFALWLKCLQLCFQHYDKGRINYNFGSWADIKTIRSVSEWQFCYQPISGFLFSKQDKGYLYGESTSKRKTFARYIAQDPGFMTLLFQKTAYRQMFVSIKMAFIRQLLTTVTHPIP
jgi:hypothetical protein